jgi:poly-gamma-glutamate biosynthesis protein PgsC/CapC
VHDYLVPIAVVRFAFIAGVVVSMLMYERRHLTTGSLVVPGYVAVFLLVPSVIVATILNSAMSNQIVNKVLMRWVLLYGRAKFTVLAILSISIQAIMLKMSPHGPWLWESDMPWFVGVGYVVPALIAHDMARQGIGKTAKAVLLASVIVAVPILLAVVFRLPEVTQLAPVWSIGRTHLQAAWIPLAVLLSASAAWGVSTNHGLRSGGFIGGALVAVFAVNPLQILFLVGVAVITYVLVTRVLMTRLILFGRRKFASMLLISSGFVWTSIWVGERLLPIGLQSQLGVTSVALTPLFLPGLLANDMQRATVPRVLVGVTLTATFVLSATWAIQDLTTGGAQSPVRTAIALASTATIFSGQLLQVGLAIWALLGRAVGSLAQPALAWIRTLSLPPSPSVDDIEPRVAPGPLRMAVEGPRLAPHPARLVGALPERSAWQVDRDEARARGVAPRAARPATDGYRPRHMAVGDRRGRRTVAR